jgi:hypothetical protein
MQQLNQVENDLSLIMHGLSGTLKTFSDILVQTEKNLKTEADKKAFADAIIKGDIVNKFTELKKELDAHNNK